MDGFAIGSSWNLMAIHELKEMFQLDDGFQIFTLPKTNMSPEN